MLLFDPLYCNTSTVTMTKKLLKGTFINLSVALWHHLQLYWNTCPFNDLLSVSTLIDAATETQHSHPATPDEWRADVKSQRMGKVKGQRSSVILRRLEWQPNQLLHPPPLIDLQMPCCFRCRVTHSIKYGCKVNMALLVDRSPLTGLALLTWANCDLLSRDRSPFPSLPPSLTLLLAHLSMIMSPSDSKSRKNAGGQEILHCCFLFRESIGKPC